MKTYFTFSSIIILTSLLLHSCASLNPKLKDQIVLEENKQQPTFKMYLIGDVGKPDNGYKLTDNYFDN